MAGANSVHKTLKDELKNYIKSQYFGKTKILIPVVEEKFDEEGLIYKRPYIESSPAYKSVENGIEKLDIPDWLKDFFMKLSKNGLGVYPSPFVHQLAALENACKGKDLFVSTGTGSGKTECFMWPLLAKLASEAHNNEDSWSKRGVRTIIMYPMNALVSDQVSRLRRLIGDKDEKFLTVFRDVCDEKVRRPQFGMYTGRTPYPGIKPKDGNDDSLRKTLSKLVPKENDSNDYIEKLTKEGKVPAKKDMNLFLENLKNHEHITDPEDAEMITRFEMQKTCPDILITNYSMLEYMLFRPRESKIWDDTKTWLDSDKNNKLLFVIDEAHMYKGSSGGEVALLIRRLFNRLGIDRSRVQFILTTASMPSATEEDKKKVRLFAKNLTAAKDENFFIYLNGEREDINGKSKYNVPFEKFISCSAENIEAGGEKQLEELNKFWQGLSGVNGSFATIDEAAQWMYDNLIYYNEFWLLMQNCRGSAVSLEDLAKKIFPNASVEVALSAVSVLLAIAPIAKNDKGAILFPARMHMLFKGINGVYACTNEDCPHSKGDDKLKLGDVFFTDENMVCPHCGSVVYELYNDRRCGALFFKGYVIKSDIDNQEKAYLWKYHGQLMDEDMSEIHLYIPEKDYKPKNKKNIKPCYLDVKNGFVFFDDDSMSGKEGIRKLFYFDAQSDKNSKKKTDKKYSKITFSTCPHCEKTFSGGEITSFSTRGNQSFFNLIQSQFNVQPPVLGKEDKKKFPNEGRKVLLFSDSRQRAAKLARDMSDTSDITAARQLFIIAINEMSKVKGCTLDDIYGFFCYVAKEKNVQLFSNDDRTNFIRDCKNVVNDYIDYIEEEDDEEDDPRIKSISDANNDMKGYILRFYCSGYNTFYDSAISWLEPRKTSVKSAIKALKKEGIECSEEEFKEFFNAWLLNIFDTQTALGENISDGVRRKLRANKSLGLEDNWKFSNNIKDIMDWPKTNSKKNSEEKKAELAAWWKVLDEKFLKVNAENNQKKYVGLDKVVPKYDESHIWYKCEKCANTTPYKFKGVCPICGSERINEMTDEDYNALSFWRNPIKAALKGEKIRVIDTEEHTAQVSYNDKVDSLWSKTEQYELRFQDMIQGDETPVDILSSTTTMEVGIDIGSLVAVGLRNIPPMRENYQQRAGRAGRRGSSLSTIVTFCEDGPHDTMYFKNPEPMFSGEPRSPWIDIKNEKLVQRHLNLIVIQEYLNGKDKSIDELEAVSFLDYMLNDFENYVDEYKLKNPKVLIPEGADIELNIFKSELKNSFKKMNEKRKAHPELYPTKCDKDGNDNYNWKSLLDALYEESIIPTYSFPKNVVSAYVYGVNKDTNKPHSVDRGIDIAIGEYAPGRNIVVDKKTYKIGGFYYPKSEYNKEKPCATGYINDPNYNKEILKCNECNWFGLKSENYKKCPFCGNAELEETRNMLVPWGFGPVDGDEVKGTVTEEEYTAVQQPLYSTISNSEDMNKIKGCKNIKMVSRTNQRIIMLNKGNENKGFSVCGRCGAAVPGDNSNNELKNLNVPFRSKSFKSCAHYNVLNVNLGYDFITDMLVLEIGIDPNIINTDIKENQWLTRAAQSFAEAFRLAVSKKLDVEFTELVTGYRIRRNTNGVFVDIYIYDSLSSGAGYAVSVEGIMSEILEDIRNILKDCTCANACYNCLKHYRNQYVHNVLDRYAALQLLDWAVDGKKAEALAFDEQVKLLKPLESILNQDGYTIITDDTLIWTEKHGKRKQIIVHPAMCIMPYKKDVIYISDEYLKYSKPYAVKNITDNM